MQDLPKYTGDDMARGIVFGMLLQTLLISLGLMVGRLF